MRMKKLTLIIGIFSIVVVSCSRKIDFDLPPVEPVVAVEGQIVDGLPPIVVLTETQGYFEPTDVNTVFGTFVHNADVRMNDGSQEYQLQELCTNSIPDSLIPQVSALLGVDPVSLQYFDFCVYTSFDLASFGVQGKTYDLTITTTDKNIHASTTIPVQVPLDTVWFEPTGDLDSLGFMWATLSDPSTDGNAYRWAAQRINSYTYGADSGKIKDPMMVTPLGSVFDDKFFNGLSFDFQYNRGKTDADESSESPNEYGYFKRGDTVVVQFSTISFPVFKYIRSLENQVASSGSPFASPGNLEYNIEGDGVGIWAGYTHFYDTVVCE